MHYHETYRPQFHFTARQNWINDPNGCVFYAGEYHLFFQHNPSGNQWGNMTWGHAVSPDLVRWRQLEHAILPYGGHDIFSGSAVVDWDNTAGLQSGPEKTLVALFTHATGPFEQALAYSNDRGRTWQLYNDGAAVIPNQGLDTGERDPKVFWHAPSRRWVLVLYVGLGKVRFFNSPDLKNWTFTSDFEAPGFFECPDLLALALDENRHQLKYVLHDAALTYWVGDFDGERFTAEAGPLQIEHSPNFYAAQSWSDTPGRCIQIAWLRDGAYPEMPFNGQMSFPCELFLVSTPEGPRLRRQPVAEIIHLYADDESEQPGGYELEVEVQPGGKLDLQLGALRLAWQADVLTLAERSIPLPAQNGTLRLRLLVDRASLRSSPRMGCSRTAPAACPGRNRRI